MAHPKALESGSKTQYVYTDWPLNACSSLRIYQRMALKKTLISLRLDPEVLAWYRTQTGYQLMMQDVLKRHMARTLNPMPGEIPMTVTRVVKPSKKSVESEKAPVTTSAEGLESGAGSPHLTKHSDSSHDDLILETVRQPLYDTQVQPGLFDMPLTRREEYRQSAPNIVFFQNPAGRGPAFTNLASAGVLTWPKRFDVDGIRISFSHLVDISEASISFTVGEKLYLCLALKNMERDDDPIKDEERGPLLPRMRLKHAGINPTIFIPSLQSFMATLNTGGKHFESAETRVQLDGLLHRAIQ
jgi:BrnA antitoxin of type II toxin-antitoxin system